MSIRSILRSFCISGVFISIMYCLMKGGVNSPEVFQQVVCLLLVSILAGMISYWFV
jgi:hypothetical protein